MNKRKCVIKRGLMFKNYTECLLNNKIILKSWQWFKSDCHNVYTEQIYKIALSSNDKTAKYPYETNAFKVCKTKMLSKYKWSILMIMQMKTKHKTI